MTEEIMNAQIEKTKLGMEDHGIYEWHIFVSADGWGQGFGGYAIDAYDKVKKERIGHAFGAECIMRILKAVGVDNWEDLKGTYIRIKRRDGMIVAIGHIIEDKWFDPKETWEELFEEEESKKNPSPGEDYW